MSQLSERSVEKVRETPWAKAAAAIFWALVTGPPYIARSRRKKHR